MGASIQGLLTASRPLDCSLTAAVVAEDLDEEDRRPMQRRRVDPDASDMLSEEGDEVLHPAALVTPRPLAAGLQGWPCCCLCYSPSVMRAVVCAEAHESGACRTLCHHGQAEAPSGLQPALGVDISAKRGPTAQWVAKDIVQQGIQRLFREFLHTFSLQGERVYQGRLREMCACAPPACLPVKAAYTPHACQAPSSRTQQNESQ